ncbi:LLM class F420-dependent oxidoreductase [Amycolatopsis sp. FDAARGOS 1241]|uniref:LLM class F420-dependent oxidoreductase n=1 Tax=Amycolatopsis sp. FDAARGOS 1241 TaxID=2778070 RepID=UPI0019509DF6|nr:LLM class F420-dependent oxidoreductase [Amycolatopsis sp. FDAARGOS 1241]QRP48447.1 LLM class F420-dependent oxidoreductase [Amycolatopsis sp. FDAARGOS 1241]
MELSYYLPTGTTHEFAGYTSPVVAFDKLLELARVADESGFTTIWAPDHFIPFGPSGSFVFEAWTTLAALARETRTARLGQLVTGNGYRNPALLAKMASTLDVVSGGRLTFGIGAGWYEDEYRAFGYDFPGAGERLRRLEESLQIIAELWTGNPATFAGRYFSTDGAVNLPTGVQAPHPPVMVAGGGEKVTLRLVALYGDLCNVQESPDEVHRKYGILARHCETVGRDYSAITKTSTTYCITADTDDEARAAVPPWAQLVFPGDLAGYGLVGTIDTIRNRLDTYREAGVDELIIGFQNALDADTLRTFAAEFVR